MANSLLDFVMSVVRDPDAAAAYAANPAQAIADAHLTDVTSVDVNNLIPVVAESMAAAVPTGGSSGFAGAADTLGDAAHNVWASGAATAAFDAFGDHLPLASSDVGAGHVFAAANVIDQPLDSATTFTDHVIDDGSVPSAVTALDPAVILEAPVFDDPRELDVHDVAAVDDAIDAGHHAVDHPQDHPQDPGFDIFT